MSTPKNHHYVSQCHSKCFFNTTENKIYLYDKLKDNFFSKNTTKTIFSEDYSNSTLINGKVNHDVLEKDLKQLAEDDLPEIIKTVEYICQNPELPHGERLEHLCKLTLYGLIGEMRNPKHKKRNDYALLNAFIPLAKLGSQPMKQLAPFFKRISNTKYSNVVSYSKIAFDLINRMGDLSFTIFFIKSSDLFILPDTTSFHIRAKINTYFNPDIEEVAVVGIPLTNKIFILVESKKLPDTSNRFYTIEEKNSSQVNAINKRLFDHSEQYIATSNLDELKRIVEISKGDV